MISALLGGVIGLGVSTAVGWQAAIVIAGLIYAGSSLVARSLSDPMAHPDPPSERAIDAVVRVVRELADGLKQIWIRPPARLPLIGVFLLRTFAMFASIAAILVITSKYSGDFETVASVIALGAAGAGALCGALVAPTLGRRFLKPGLMMVGFVVSGLGTAALGGISALAAVVPLTFSGGFGNFTAKVAVDAQIQEALPDKYRGRAFAAYDIGYNLASVVAALTMVALGDLSLRTSLVVAGLLALAISAGLGLLMKRAGMSFVRLSSA